MWLYYTGLAKIDGTPPYLSQKLVSSIKTELVRLLIKFLAQLFNGHSNISMVLQFVQNFIFTVINPLIPTCKKWVIFIKFWWAPWYSLPLVASILQWDSFHKVPIVNFIKYYRLSMKIEGDTTVYMVNPRVGFWWDFGLKG